MSRLDEQELKTMTEAQIIEAIRNKKALLGQMVGSLYPSIVRDEIRQLHIQLSKSNK